ncbi:MAG: hypothetical protein LM561_05725 [Desulfurococcaceae archaeon]|jgi:hypothetical protein|nr:hypothetical protein [Desulfurococcaceae archaeon]
MGWVRVFKVLKKILREFVSFVKGVNQAIIEDSVSALELEHNELEAAFLTMVLGPLVGVATLSPILSLELLEALKNEVKVLESRAVRGEDVLGDLMASLGGEW